MLTPINDTVTFDEKSKIPTEMLHDSGLLFFAYSGWEQEDLKKLEYRLIIDGLWTVDPSNPVRRFDTATGKEYSVAPVPRRVSLPKTTGNPPGILHFSMKTESGESITVAGDFNNWDPFMYQLRETAAGLYVLDLPVPAGIWRYSFFVRGEQINDPNNPAKEWTSDGKPISVVSVK